jgi:predicted dehydrogenase
VADLTAQPVRIAIVGTGTIARSHAQAIAGQPGAVGAATASIVAAMDVDQSQLATFCAEFHIPGSYGDLATLLSQARPILCTSARRRARTTRSPSNACAAG